MSVLKSFVLVLAIAVGLAGCAGAGRNQQAGAGIGAAGGAIAGAVIANNSGVNPIVGALIGGIGGAIVGGAIGAALDERERAAYVAAQRRTVSARAGQRISWSATNNQGQRTTGWLLPQASYTSGGRQCRSVQAGVNKAGQSRTETLTQCRSGSGWSLPA